MPPDKSPQDSSGRPVNQLKEGDAAEAKKETWGQVGNWFKINIWAIYQRVLPDWI